MIYFALNKNNYSFVMTTNIKAIEEFTGIPYHRVYRILSNGVDLKETDDFIFAWGEPVKGKQRIPGRPKKKKSKGPPEEIDDFDNFFKHVK